MKRFRHQNIKDSKGYFARLDEKLLCSSSLTGNDLRVYCILSLDAIKHHGGEYSCLSLREICKASGGSISYATVQRAMKKLAASNLIKKSKGKYFFSRQSCWVLY